ncbi:kynureninase [Actinopolyspora sp. H202]|uniref:kynureninase n=1 Tax=Actinopolyspora sp. H202 TaxID=1500456 RepID=UPI003EE489C8
MTDRTDFATKARELDDTDPLGDYPDRFLPTDDDIVAYFDGNSLGRPPAVTAERMEHFVRHQWRARLIRGWDDEWLDWPTAVGDRLGEAVLGAAPGQLVVADSTTVLLYKLARAALHTRPERGEILLDTDNFPTDRYVVEGIADEHGLTLRWIETDPTAGITSEQVANAIGPNTALVVFSHVAYRSGYLADAAAITRLAHEAGALALWDLSHSAGAVPVELDDWDVDFAVGCGYKYLNGGPGAPAFAYVNGRHQHNLRQPIQGWMGHRSPFTMGPGHEPAPGIRSVLSGTPPILGMVPLLAGVELLEQAGTEAIRAKSLLLSDFALELADVWLPPLGVRVASPREHHRRGGHVTLCRADFEVVTEELRRRGVVPDFRAPDGIRIGLSPLSTRFTEVYAGMATLAEVAAQRHG